MTIAWKAQGERGNRWMIGLMVFVAIRLGRSIARGLLYPVCLYYLWRSSGVNKHLREYYRRALGLSPHWQVLFHHYYWFASTILDRVYFLRGRVDKFEIKIHGMETLNQALAAGHGCLLLGSHLGSFEVLRVLGLLKKRMEVKVLMDERNAPLIREFIQKLNPSVSDTVIQVGGVDTMLQVRECLERGGLVGIMGDRLTSKDQFVLCDFLGMPAAFPTGWMRLAHAVGAPVMLFFGIYRGADRYEVHLESLGQNVRLSSERREEGFQKLMQRYADRLSFYSREAPDNWFNFYDFWHVPR